MKKKIKNMSIKLLCLVLCNIVVPFIDAQTALKSDREGLPYNMPTPTMSNLGAFGIVPVSMYTGKADVSIPVTTLEERGVVLNVKLSYDTSGLLINQLPGWTGHGWTLMAGGAITRKINNYPDELSWDDNGTTQSQFTGYFNCVKNLEKSKLESYIQAPGSYKYANDFAVDIFYFNFMGKSGSFFLGTDGDWKVSCDENLCVIFDIYDESNYIYPYTQKHPSSNLSMTDKEPYLPKTIKGFTIIDSNGIRYIFGGDTSAIEYSTDLMSTAQHNISSRLDASSWMLKSIEDRFGNVLYTFNYSRGKYLVQIVNADLKESYHVNSLIGPLNSFGISHNYSATLNIPVYIDSICSNSGTIISFKRNYAFPDTVASHILYPSFYEGNGTPNGNLANMGEENKRNELEFYYLQEHDMPEVYSLQANRNVDKKNDPLSSMEIELLNKISVCNGKSTYDYLLHYDYNNRIHLDSIKIQASDQQVSSYSFKYNGYNLVPQDYLTGRYDHWGYYNGINRNQYKNINNNVDVNRHDVSIALDIDEDKKYPIIPTAPIDVFAPSFKCTKYGMLEEITYPTGGKTQLEYELNEYNQYISAARTAVIRTDSTMKAGGLRIKRITNIENGKCSSACSYDYLSSGTLYNQPQNAISWNADGYFVIDNYPNANTSKVTFQNAAITTSQNTSIIPLSNSFAPHITYENVKKIDSNGGFRIESYTKMEDVLDQPFLSTVMGSVVTPFTRYCERNYLRGRLLKEQTFDKDSELMSEVSYKYTDDALFNGQNYVVATNVRDYRQERPLPYSGNETNVRYVSFICGTVFNLFYPKILLKEKITRIKMDNQWLCDTTIYQYDDILLSIKSLQKDSIHSNITSLSKQIQKRGGDNITIEYYYPYNDELNQKTRGINGMNWDDAQINTVDINNALISQYCLNATSIKRIQQGKTIDQTYNILGYCNGNVVTKYSLLRYGELEYSNLCDTIYKYLSYTDRYLPTEVIDQFGIKYHYFWDAKDRLVAIMANGSDVVQLNASNNALNVLSGPDIFGNKPVYVTTCVYNNLGQISDITTANRQTRHYDYDLLLRLIGIKDQDNHYLKIFGYHYKTSVGSENLNINNQAQPVCIPKNNTRYTVE